MNKSIFQSKMFWLNLVAFISALLPGVGDFLRKNPVDFVAFLTALNVALRFFTSGKVTLFAPSEDAPPRARVIEETRPSPLSEGYRGQIFGFTAPAVQTIEPVPLLPRGIDKPKIAKPVDRAAELLRVLRAGDMITFYPKDKERQTPDNLCEGKVVSVEGRSFVVEHDDGLIERHFFEDWHVSLSLN